MKHKRILIIIITSLFIKYISAQDSAFVNFITDYYLNVELKGILVVKIKNIESKKTIEYALPSWIFYEIYEKNTLYPTKEAYLTLTKSILLNHSVYSVTSLNEKYLKEFKVSNIYYNKLKFINLDSLENKYFDKYGNIVEKINKNEINAVIKILFEHNVFVYIGCFSSKYYINKEHE